MKRHSTTCRGAFASFLFAASFTALWVPGAAAQQAATSGASHEIRIVAVVPPTCQLGQIGARGGSGRAVLSGRTDSGEAVHIEFTPSTGFNVECNTAYALSLQRVGMPGPGTRRAAAGGNQVAAAKPKPDSAPEPPAGFDVLVEIADRKLPPGAVAALEQRCVFGSLEALDEHCAIQADGLPLLPRRRNVARLTVMPRATAAATDIVTDAEVVDELELMAQSQLQGQTSLIATGSLPARGPVRQPAVIREHLMLSVTGRF